jgi:hypothetical protein
MWYHSQAHMSGPLVPEQLFQDVRYTGLPLSRESSTSLACFNSSFVANSSTSQQRQRVVAISLGSFLLIVHHNYLAYNKQIIVVVTFTQKDFGSSTICLNRHTQQMGWGR